MSEASIKIDETRAAALEAAVSAGGAASLQAAVEDALDSWLADQALAQVDDVALQALWREGLDSGDAGQMDFSVLKAEARRAAGGA